MLAILVHDVAGECCDCPRAEGRTSVVLCRSGETVKTACYESRVEDEEGTGAREREVCLSRDGKEWGHDGDNSECRRVGGAGKRMRRER